MGTGGYEGLDLVWGGRFWFIGARLEDRGWGNPVISSWMKWLVDSLFD